ncbi:MAG: hypothetical protein ACC662_02430 [Planctomycetota bacterium]
MPNPAVFFVLALLAMVVLGYLAYRSETKRRKALLDWATAHGFRYRAGKNRALADRFSAFRCLREGLDRYAENVMVCSRPGGNVWAFDFHYETRSTNSKGQSTTTHHRFSAVVVETVLPLKPLVIRPENFFDRITEFFGLDDIDFESTAFSNAFYVTSPDRRWAFDVLGQATMEYLLDAPRFTLEMAGPWFMARRSSRLDPEDFSAALAVLDGILDRLPGYLRRELEGERS